MYTIKEDLLRDLQEIETAGLFFHERILQSPQGAIITVQNQQVLNFCSNNYLGFANNPEIIGAAKEGMDNYGFGLSSVRFICGTQEIHKELEHTISRFMQTEDSILYGSCFDANAGLFQTFFKEGDAIISDKLNHASIVEGVRLSKASRYMYENCDMQDLKKQLLACADAKRKIICTDGVFSMDGVVAPLKEITELAEQHGALVMVDDSHATGCFGPTGRGSAEYHGVMQKIDITTSTFGKALGGASGGFTTGRKEIISYLRQRSRPYLFSNTLPPAVVAASLKALHLLETTGTESIAHEKLVQLHKNTTLFRKEMVAAGFDIPQGIHGLHPICPVMLGDAKIAQEFAQELLREHIYVIGFSYPVVPIGKARIRVQMSADHTEEQVLTCVVAFIKIGEKLGVI